MKNLDANWLTQEWIDFEYKKYLLLAYLQHAQRQFGDQKLYPVLADLVEHYRSLKEFQENKQFLREHFPKDLSRLDLKKLKLNYQDLHEDSDLFEELNQIIEYAIPQFDRTLQQGKSIYEEVAEQIAIESVGITPMYFREGYIFLEEVYRRHILVYRYAVSIFRQAEETFRAIQWKFLERVQRSLGQTHENLKISLVRRHQELPNPATFLILLEKPYPFEETFLPVAKRALMQHLAWLEVKK